ncbi:uncharacterized protein LOC143921507 [Arctopsyche grandis]|uniref:uncharacterized protein LOC143921507 n=1 Tax=Arctopsyche grandis TaxID=121162 RepID=UPI00406D7777
MCRCSGSGYVQMSPDMAVCCWLGIRLCSEGLWIWQLCCWLVRLVHCRVSALFAVGRLVCCCVSTLAAVGRLKLFKVDLLLYCFWASRDSLQLVFMRVRGMCFCRLGWKLLERLAPFRSM